MYPELCLPICGPGTDIAGADGTEWAHVRPPPLFVDYLESDVFDIASRSTCRCSSPAWERMCTQTKINCAHKANVHTNQNKLLTKTEKNVSYTNVKGALRAPLEVRQK